uniref:rho guanine nucleotide exchange factor TIAM2-like isoform X3 n=1 Tax=Centroberyx gerrardi TaxID=166262 RepID=UPI003AACA35C
MGNSESQYSIQGPKGTSFIFPGKQKPCSLKFRSTKEEVLSPHTWWKNAPGGSGYKARCVGRGCLSPPKSRQPYSTRHYDYVSKGARGSPGEHRWHRSPGCGVPRRHMPDDYEDNPYGAELNGHTLNGHSDEHEGLEEQSSPRVVIKKDGSLRVEFTNSSGSALLLDEASGPVQLLKFSPNLESASTPSLPGSSGRRPEAHRSGPPPASTSSMARTSKGSSLSSEGSWYDSPWGPATELCEPDQPCTASRTLVHSPIHQLDSFTEQSPPVSITDLYRDPTMAATFPTAGDLSSQFQEPPPGQRPHRASFASVLDVPMEEECPEGRPYSSYTLPCRRPKAHTMSEGLDQYPGSDQYQEQAGPDFSFQKKDSIKNRIRRLSDWTGSLSRKKRKSQASNQTDLENWVTAIHSASASLLAKRQGKEDTVRLLRSQVRGLLQKIDMDGKMKKMAELQLTVVSDPKNRKAIENQIQQWEQNLERFNMDLFRMRCYLASLQGGELPNPKSLLAIASRPTKTTLGRLGIFSVSSFHALICSRDEATLRRRSVSLTHRQRKRGLFSSLKGLDNLTRRGRDKRPSASQIFESDAGGQAYFLPPTSTERLDVLTNIYSMSPPEGGVWDGSSGGTEVLTCVYMPDSLTVQVPVRRDQTAAELLSTACKVKQLDPDSHCLRLHRQVGQDVEVRYLAPGELLHDVAQDQLEVVPLNVFTLHMSRPSGTGDFGFAVTGHIDGQKNSRIFVSEVLPDGLAFSEGLRPGDEILVLNGRCVSGLDLTLIQTLFAEQALHLSLRRDGPMPLALASGHPTPPPRHNLEAHNKHHRAKSSSDVCTVADGGESLGLGMENGHSHHAHRPVQHSKSVDTVCTLYQSFQDGVGPGSGGLMEDAKEPPAGQGLGSGPAGEATTLLRPCPKHMSATERLRKVIQELVDTEKSYVKDLACLFEIYLKPLQNETFLTLDEMESLFGSLPEMLDFQRVFLQTLEERIASSPDFSTLETPAQFKKLLFSLGGSFLYYADHFKLYSGFCANHIKVQKVLERAKTDQAFKEFLDARNPTKQHSSTLESYLIKPVQRVLKYPLLLRELVSLTDADSEEHYHLNEALKAMEKVASHINEMQKIYEDYGSVFDQLVAEQTGHDKEVTEISMGEFLMHSSAVWLNPHPSLGRMRKDPEMTVFVFKKAVILVYRENNKLKKKMTNPRSALSHGDVDPFKFRWLIPLSALQVRLGNTAGTGAESSCIWELIHTRSEVEGRPETVFQLCSSVPECKVNIIKVIRSILRENVRRNMRSDGMLDRTCKERLTPLRCTLPSSARIGSSRASWLCKQPLVDLPAQAGNPKPGPDSDESGLSSGTGSSSGAPAPRAAASDPRLSPSQQSWSQHPPSTSVKESDILSDEDDDGFSEAGGRRRESGGGASPTSAIEAQFLQLKLSEEAASGLALAPRVQPEGGEVDTPECQPKLTRGLFNPVKRKTGSSFRRSQGALVSMKEHSRSLDSQTDGVSSSGAVDLNALLEREFSVQSLTSVVNEDCFYDPAESCATDSGNAPTS